MPRSASVWTVVWSLEVLLSSLGSGVGLCTVAVFVSTPSGTLEATLTTRVIEVLALVPSPAARVHVTVWPAAAQLQPPPVPDEKDIPAGRTSVTVTGPA